MIIMQIVSVVFAMALCVTMSRSLTMGLLEKRCTAGTNMLSVHFSAGVLHGHIGTQVFHAVDVGLAYVALALLKHNIGDHRGGEVLGAG